MSRYPGANWRGPVPNMAVGGMSSHRLFVVHIQEGTESGTDSWVHNPAAQVSAHFGNPRVGRPDQWVDTDDRAWAQAAYNNVAISVENEGHTGDSLNPNQLENAAQLLAWAHVAHGTKLQVTDDPNGEGVIGHGLLGTAGGNHPDCPGQPILNQRQAIVDRAFQIIQGADMAALESTDPNLIALYWRVKALTDLNPTVQDGPTKGEPNALAALLASVSSEVKAIPGSAIDYAQLAASLDYDRLGLAIAQHLHISAS